MERLGVLQHILNVDFEYLGKYGALIINPVILEFEDEYTEKYNLLSGITLQFHPYLEGTPTDLSISFDSIKADEVAIDYKGAHENTFRNLVQRHILSSPHKYITKNGKEFAICKISDERVINNIKSNVDDADYFLSAKNISTPTIIEAINNFIKNRTLRPCDDCRDFKEDPKKEELLSIGYSLSHEDAKVIFNRIKEIYGCNFYLKEIDDNDISNPISYSKFNYFRNELNSSFATKSAYRYISKKLPWEKTGNWGIFIKYSCLYEVLQQIDNRIGFDHVNHFCHYIGDEAEYLIVDSPLLYAISYAQLWMDGNPTHRAYLMTEESSFGWTVLMGFNHPIEVKTILVSNE